MGLLTNSDARPWRVSPFVLVPLGTLELCTVHPRGSDRIVLRVLVTPRS